MKMKFNPEELSPTEEVVVRRIVRAVISTTEEWRCDPDDVYVGITDNCTDRRAQHKVPNGNGWRCWSTPSERISRAAEKELIERGYRGGPGGGGIRSRFVYAYTIIPGVTREDT